MIRIHCDFCGKEIGEHPYDENCYRIEVRSGDPGRTVLHTEYCKECFLLEFARVLKKKKER